MAELPSKETIKGAKVAELGGGDASPYGDPVATETVKGDVIGALVDGTVDPKLAVAKHGMAKDTIKGKQLDDMAEAWVDPG